MKNSKLLFDGIIVVGLLMVSIGLGWGIATATIPIFVKLVLFGMSALLLGSLLYESEE